MEIKTTNQDITNELKQIREILFLFNQNFNLLEKKDTQDLTAVNNRLADLETKMAKLWGLITEQTPAGKDKLSRYGKSFQGSFNGRN